MFGFTMKYILFCGLIASVASKPWRLEDELERKIDAEIDDSLRLPKDSFPTHYKVDLTTNVHLGDTKFSGKVDIHLNVTKETDQLVLHYRKLEITSAKLSFIDEGEPQELPNPTIAVDPETEFLTIGVDTPLKVASYILVIEFNGELQTNDQGFYLSSYINLDGERIFLATTQFESTNARYAFPCYDEPALKATFDISIVHWGLFNAISNMEGTRNNLTEMEGYSRTIFDTTPRMSTYLIAFVVSDFKFRTDKKLHKVYVRPNAYYKTVLAMEAGQKILSKLDEYFKIPYTKYVPKMTQVAVPDFKAGAMENWGLVTYREPNLLFDNLVSTYRQKVSIATVISHEFAHQWFGNLVTPKWWDYIWLNEGFATLYEYYGTHLVYSDWGLMDLFRIQHIQAAFIPDGLENTRPMTHPASTPNQISGLFDRIAYAKSGSVLHMFMHVFNEEHWKAGLTNYLNARQLNTADADDLSAGLQKEINETNILPESVTVKLVMDSWTTEKGYPLLEVKRSYSTGAITLSQERFISTKKESNTNVWWIPYNFAIASSPDFEDTESYEWLSTKAGVIHTKATSSEWIVFNKQQVGFYRINYDAKNWNLLIDALKDEHTQIHRLNRAQLIDDSWNLARSERLDYSVAFNVMSYLGKEHEYVPWASADKALNYLRGKLVGRDIYEDFHTFVNHLVEPVYKEIDILNGTAEVPMLHKYTVQLISTWACNLGYEDCLTKTKNALKEAVEFEENVQPDISAVVYCQGLKSADEENMDAEFIYLYGKMMTSDDQSYRTLLIDSLACSTDPEHLEAFLDTSIGSTTEINYSSVERNRIVSSIYSSGNVGLIAVMDYLRGGKRDEFINVLGQSTLNSAISGIAARINNKELSEEFDTLLESLGDKITEQTKTSAKATIQQNMAWSSTREGVFVGQWLKDFIYETENTPEPTETTIVTSPTTPSANTTIDPEPTTQKPGGGGGASTTVLSIVLLVFSVVLNMF